MDKITRVLVIEAEKKDARFIMQSLQLLHVSEQTAWVRHAEDGLQRLDRHEFDCIVLELELPEMTGQAFIDQVVSQYGSRRPALIVMTGRDCPRSAAAALKGGAADFLCKRHTGSGELAAAVRAACRERSGRLLEVDRRRRLEYLASHDALTGLGNRNAFDQALLRLLHGSRRDRDRFSVIAIDLDRFKQLNDSYGHQAGDAALREAARRLKQISRESDCFYRIGGDEFLGLIRTRANPEALEQLRQRLKQVLSAPMMIECIGRVPVQLGASVGMAHFPADGSSEEELLRAADQAMYRDKRGGLRLSAIFRWGRSRKLVIQATPGGRAAAALPVPPVMVSPVASMTAPLGVD